MARARRILHPSDFSAASGPAFARAVDMAKHDGAELILLHVLPLLAPLIGDGYVSPKMFEEMQRATRVEGQKRLDALLRKAQKARVRVTPLLREGVAWREITRTAKSKRADLIVMGTHGRTGFAKLFLGSVAERVLATSPCAVLTVRAR